MSYFVTLQSSGKRFAVEGDESVLDAARRAGLALPYSCLSGVCGSCKATLVSGECHYPHNPPSALNPAEVARHQVLLCQAVPSSDVVVAAREVASVADIPRRVMPLKVRARERLAPDVMRLLLSPPRGQTLAYLAGQYVDVLLPASRSAPSVAPAALGLLSGSRSAPSVAPAALGLMSGSRSVPSVGGRRRAFSIANAPHLGPDIELHIRHVAGGDFTHHVFTALEPGDLLRIEGPLGTFVPREHSERPMLFVAGGTGFAPVKALIEHFLHLGTRRPMHLYWGARAPEELYLRALPERWAAATPSLRFVAVISDRERRDGSGLRAGFVHEAVLEDHPDLGAFDVYMSGPPALIDAGRRSFVDAGLPEDRLYYDSFDYAPDVLAQILKARAGIDES